MAPHSHKNMKTSLLPRPSRLLHMRLIPCTFPLATVPPHTHNTVCCPHVCPLPMPPHHMYITPPIPQTSLHHPNPYTTMPLAHPFPLSTHQPNVPCRHHFCLLLLLLCMKALSQVPYRLETHQPLQVRQAQGPPSATNPLVHAPICRLVSFQLPRTFVMRMSLNHLIKAPYTQRGRYRWPCDGRSVESVWMRRQTSFSWLAATLPSVQHVEKRLPYVPSVVWQERMLSSYIPLSYSCGLWAPALEKLRECRAFQRPYRKFAFERVQTTSVGSQPMITQTRGELFPSRAHTTQLPAFLAASDRSFIIFALCSGVHPIFRCEQWQTWKCLQANWTKLECSQKKTYK
mmetsp:Transcript_20409/g.33538  ORF Transcript_20409/g.33538 Transcript_20409/m.33538 type:complete len:344 (+) Transcript_20409:2517-3548(+)